MILGTLRFCRWTRSHDGASRIHPKTMPAPPGVLLFYKGVFSSAGRSKRSTSSRIGPGPP